MPDAKGLFAVLNSEQSTATLWNSEVYKQVSARNRIRAATSSQLRRPEPHLTASATLRGLVDAELVGAFDGLRPEPDQIAATEHEWEANRLRRRTRHLRPGEDPFPVIGPIAGEAIDRVGGALQDEILGNDDAYLMPRIRSTT